MFQYNVTPSFYLEAGPKFSFIVNNKVKGDNAIAEAYYGTLLGLNNKDNFNSFDFGLGIGAGYYFIPNLGVTLRYTAGLTDIYKNNSGDAVKNNVFQAGLAYKF